MNPLLLRTLQIGGAVAILVLGALIGAQTRGDPMAEACVMALVGVSLLCLALGRVASPATPPVARAAQDGDKEAARKAQDHLVEAALQQFIKLIREYVILNSKYADDLTGINDSLLQLPSRNDVQDIIVKLINTNLAMQLKVQSMAKELEASERQIVALRNNISEVGKIAMVDALTELGNRRFFDQALQKEIERANETGAGLCLAMADIDRFKAVNDRFGHLVGDHLLKLFAGVLTANVRGPDVAARYGGEEFALLFPGAGLDEAFRVVEKIRRELESKRWVVGPKEERLGAITASFGIARLAFDEAAESFVRRADAKLLEAKRAGRNRVALDRPGQSPSRATIVVD
jgi:diguanylate cyclase